MSNCLTPARFGASTLRPKPIAYNLPQTQVRHATLIRRPKRPYTFTQLVTLSDGSSYIHRTSSPQSVYTSTKDQRNAPLWNPSSQKLLNVEMDEAGRLKAFRDKFGRGWDAQVDTGKEADGQHAGNSFLDLISETEVPKKSKSQSAEKSQKKGRKSDK